MSASTALLGARRIGRGVAAIGAGVTLTVVIPIVLSAVSERRFGTRQPLAGLRPPWTWHRSEVENSIRRPLEDDTVVDVIVRSCLVVVWIALAVVVVTTVLETVHLLRHRGLPSPRRRGLGWAQPLARFIAVGLVGLLPMSARAAAPEPIAPLAAAPSVIALDTTDESRTAPVWSTDDRASTRSGAGVRSSLPGPSTSHTISDGGSGGERMPEGDRSLEGRPADAIHRVVRGESVWSIAAARTGGSDTDTMRLAERILDHNLGRVMNDGATFSTPALIRPGWELVIPGAAVGPVDGPDGRPDAIPDPPGSHADADTPKRATHEVRDGETLSSIAADRLGDEAAWPVIAEANLGRTMDDGRTFVDPDLIVPGWDLVIDHDDQPPSAGEDESEPAPAPPPADADADDPVGAELDDDGPAAEPRPSVRPAEAPTGDADWFAAEPEPEPDAATTPPLSSPSPPQTSTTSTSMPLSSDPAPADVSARRNAPSPLGIEHAGMLAGGLLALAAVRRRRRLRSARARARLPEPAATVVETERTLRSVGSAERRARLDVAVRAIAHAVTGTGRQPVLVRHDASGEIEVTFTGPVVLPGPWVGTGTAWSLPASIPIELLADAARRVGDPCPALIALGVGAGGEIHLDVEAAGSLTIDADRDIAESVATAITSTLATSLAAETAHLVVVGIDPAACFDHPNTITVADPASALAAAADLVGSTMTGETGTFDLRARRTGGEAWEPAVVVVGPNEADLVPWSSLPDAGHGVAVIVAAPTSTGDHAGARLRADGESWRLDVAGSSVDLEPFGVDEAALRRLDEFVGHADALPVDEAPTPTSVDDVADELGGGAPDQTGNGHDDHTTSDAGAPTSPTGAASLHSDSDDAPDLDTTTTEPPDVDPPHEIVVRLLGGVSITDVAGNDGDWQRSKTVELIAWLATHRTRSTRSAARAAMWVEDVRDATFSNIVSEARRGLARLVPPADGEEWIPRTLNDDLPLHAHVVTDLDLVSARLAAARLCAPAEAVELLRPAVELVDGSPFADTTYLWSDADGLVTDATLLATSACVELAEHALSIGDIDAVFTATSRGLTVLPGHEDSIALRMRAHARRGDLAGVRSEWESYERVVTADAWSNGEPAPELLQLRHELLNS